MRTAVYCDECMEKIELPSEVGSGEVRCSKGHPEIAFRLSEALRAGTRVDRCARCDAAAFFVQKDFDQRLGCAILAGGAGLALLLSRLFGGIWFVPVLVAFAALDLVLARRIGSVVVCYRCDTEYRDVPDAASYKPYDPHIAERYAEAKTLRRLNP